MYLKCMRPLHKYYEQIVKDYYEHSEQIVGINKLKKVSLKSLKYPFSLSIMMNLDKNYAFAINKIKEVYEKNYASFIGLYSDKNDLIAHTVVYEPAFREESTAKVYDIFVKDRELFRGSDELSFNVLINIYYHIINFVEDYLVNNNPKVDKLEFSFSFMDSDLVKALETLGFSKSKENIYVKNIKARDDLNEGNNYTKKTRR